MVKTIKKIIEHYQCSECGIQYADRAWAVACDTWCKEHGSCNLEITSHAVPKDERLEHEAVHEPTTIEDIKLKNRLFYGGIGLAASLMLLLVFYWHLRLNSSIAALISNTAGKPLYFWSYIILTLASIALFGINASLLVYRWRKFGRPKLKSQAGTGGGSVVGIAAAACPVCGSVLLSAIGITGGLAAFPLGGLELKLLSVALLALPIWFTRRAMKKMECCVDGTCPAPQDPSFKEGKDEPWFLGILAVIVLFIIVGWSMLKTDPAMAQFLAPKNKAIVNLNGNQLQGVRATKTGSPIFNEVTAKVIPEKGFQSKIVLGDSIVKLVQNGVIDAPRFADIYKDRGGFPPELKDVLTAPSNRPILLTRTNANFYVNLLWPVGLANHMDSNKSSPVNGKSLFNFASTGGWNLGKEKNGGAYFNKLGIISLTPEREALVTKIAQNSYRPCCNNSTFFQDCNHGSALLGLLQLGAAQGLSESDLWREALAFNSFWFPQQYIYNGLYFKVVKGVDWDKVDPKVVTGKDFSSGSGSGNIQAEVAKIPNLMPQQGGHGGAGCGT